MGAASEEVYQLTSPQGSAWNLASMIRADPGPDFGDSWMAARYAQNPAVDGGQFAFESAGVRTMVFPLLVANFKDLGIQDPFQVETVLRLAARPGAHLDVQPLGASAAIRFDVLSGRWKPDYDMRHNRVGVRLGSLELDVQPFGYMPTEIILASVASIALPGDLALSGAILGDVPALTRISVQIDKTPGTSYPAGSWYDDVLGWSLTGRPSFQSFWSGGSFTTFGVVGAVVGDQFAPASQALQLRPVAASEGFRGLADFSIPSALEPAYRQSFRLFAYAKLTPSQALPWQITADTTAAGGVALASAAPIATLVPAVATGSPGIYGPQPSPAFQILDLGEVDIARPASGIQVPRAIRFWGKAPTTNPGIATPLVTFGGAFLLPLPEAGFIPRGIGGYPTVSNSDGGDVGIDHITQRAVIYEGSQPFVGAQHYGVFPKIGASALRLSLLAGARKTDGVADPVIRHAPQRAGVSVTYRPSFAFVRGL